MGVGSGQDTQSVGSTHGLPTFRARREPSYGRSQMANQYGLGNRMVPEGTACGRPARDEGLRGEVRRGMLSQSLSGSCVGARLLVATGRG